MIGEKSVRWVGWKLAHLFYWIGKLGSRYGTGTGNWIIEWMEKRGVCCERHRKRV